MMKNKKAIFLLLPLVVIVWGLVAYRLFDVGKGGDENKRTEQQVSVNGDKRIQKDTFSIVADYRDPFLGTIYKKPAETSRPAIIPKKKPAPPPPPPNWPAVMYGGIIKNQHSNEQVAILTVNQQEALLTIDEEVQGIKLKKIYNKDSIEVSYREMSKTIHKQ